jgi:radical SAM protein with 4Fe4S-binding SPASM domain
MPQPPGAPLFIIMSITQRCNLRCSFCYNEEYVNGSGPKEMDGDMVKAIMDQMVDAGCLGIGLNGGEPTLRKDIFELISYAASKDLIPMLGTNGVLVDRPYARKLKEAGLLYAQVSLDGKEATHDSIRGVKGTYKKTVACIRNLVQEGVFVSVVMVATRQNWKEFDHVLKVARSCRAAKLEVLDFQNMGRAKDHEALDLDPHERDILAQRICERWAQEIGNRGHMNIIYKNPYFIRAMRRVFPRLETTPLVGASYPAEASPALGYGKRFQQGIFSVQAPFASTVTCCEAGLFAFYIDVDGAMTPCPYMPLPIGNIKKDDLHDIWVGSPVLMALRDRSNLKGVCGSCNERTLCGGCRARAFNSTGDVLASDPLCSKVSGQ